ncbi:energy-coupling factor transporter transmembrane protein EcfT [Lacrimispora sp. NSJ-141]|uniref:Energy-coupling factor transporter transmembrane protein EcfT n=1 Tax=Lientehia hominis TaxID=2897778 RepID=A0AAP2RIN2_9FIRM|nr:energy-coupling factor transporter transmembrane component T [Lientehia hominis]MCD2491558.1 energy-coupling factor transporter transmembrane protein EcfT [Lientehia hominis]
MTDRFHVKKPLYPIFSIAAAALTLIGALLLARTIWGTVFVAGVYLLLCCFGYARTCLRLLPFLLVYLGVFSLIFYFAGGRNAVFAWQMGNRLAGVAVAAIPGLSLPPVHLVRSLTSFNCPRLLTLGMLITMSFIPVLSAEIRQVKNAMRTRGVTSVLSPVLFYRAFLIPLLVRLVNISDTLALSVETRGFTAGGAFTVYHPVSLKSRDVCFGVLFLVLFLGGIAAPALGVAVL